jgi:hypothetical protein|tara:strand:+ start:148 stop:621 length:474 start_codon:yes stop_codon:yes gene_type:complete
MGAGTSSPRDWVEEERRRGRASADPAAEEALRREFAGAGSSVRGAGAGPSGRGDGGGVGGGGAGSTGARVYREHQGELLYVTKNRAKPHRCNDRVEDVIQAMFEGNPFLTVPPTVTLLRRCLNSEVGTEPEEPYLFLDLPAPTRRKEETPRKKGWFG